MSAISVSQLEHCWEILDCQRETNGAKVAELGECIASKEDMGHSCWAIAGTLCGGKVQGTAAEKQAGCMKCDVYKRYHRSIGKDGKRIKEFYPEEEKRYNDLLLNRLNKRYNL